MVEYQYVQVEKDIGINGSLQFIAVDIFSLLWNIVHCAFSMCNGIPL